MKPSAISPSVMCADFAHIADQLREMEQQGIEYLHVDIMDGVFVPNFTLGVDFCKFLKRQFQLPLLLLAFRPYLDEKIRLEKT